MLHDDIKVNKGNGHTLGGLSKRELSLWPEPIHPLDSVLARNFSKEPRWLTESIIKEMKKICTSFKVKT